MDPIPAPDLANAVTGLATVLAGVMALLLTWAAGPSDPTQGKLQPRRWMVVYAGIVVTGVPTVWYHGFGETLWAFNHVRFGEALREA